MKHFCYQCMIKWKTALCSLQPDCFRYLQHLLLSHSPETNGECCVQNATKNNNINEDFCECLPHPPFSPAMMGANTFPLLISPEINMWYIDGLKMSVTHSWKYLLSRLHKVQTIRTCQDSFLLKFASYIQQVINYVRKQSCIITAYYYTKAYNKHFCLNTLLWHVNTSIKDALFWCY